MTNSSDGRDLFDELVDDVLSSEPEKTMKPRPRVRAAVGSVRIITAQNLTIPGVRVAETMSLITARCSFGLNFIKDWMIEMRDAYGGRSKTLEKAIAQAELEVIKDLRRQATEIGAHAVVSVRIQVADLMGKGICVTAQGTPVKLQVEGAE